MVLMCVPDLHGIDMTLLARTRQERARSAFNQSQQQTLQSHVLETSTASNGIIQSRGIHFLN